MNELKAKVLDKFARELGHGCWVSLKEKGEKTMEIYTSRADSDDLKKCLIGRQKFFGIHMERCAAIALSMARSEAKKKNKKKEA